MLKRVFKEGQHRVGRLTKWVRCLQYRAHKKQSDHRAVALAAHSVYAGHLARPRLAGNQVAEAPAVAADPDAAPRAADHLAAIEAELDRLILGQPREPQQGGRRIVVWACPGGNS